jgi:hemolysin activation/secretion protein
VGRAKWIRWCARSRLALMCASVLALSIAPSFGDPVAPGPEPANPPEQSAASTPRTTEIDAYDIDGNTKLEQTEIEEAVYPFLGPDRTKDDVESARGALEKAYQAHGFQSVVVEIPPQVVREGIVKLHVVEAPVGRLRVVGSRYYSLSELKSEVPALQEGTVPDFNQAQKEIADANRLPGRQVTPLLKPGKAPGTIDVDLKVTDVLPFHASVELDNDHSQNTQPLRTTDTVRYDDFLMTGNSVSLTALFAPQRVANALVIAASDLAPILGTPWSILTFGYDSNSDVSTLGGSTVLGKGYSVGVRGVLQLPAFGSFTQTFSFGPDFKHFLENLTFQVPGTGATSVQSVTIDYTPLTASYSLQQTTGNSALNTTASVTLGLRGAGSGISDIENKRAFAQSNFVRLNLDATETYSFWHDIEAVARLSAQGTNQPLVSSEQFAAGGLTSVRGYLQSEAVGDYGAVESLELRSPSIGHYVGQYVGPYVDDWRFFAFGDAAQVFVLDALADQTNSYRLASAGLGTRLGAFETVSGQVLVGVPFISGPVSRAHQPYTQFSVKAEF